MARGRMLNKSVSASFKFNQLPDDTCRLLATWIIPNLDKNGVFYGDAGMVRSQVFPLRDDLSNAQVEAYLQAIEGVTDDEGRKLMIRFKARGRTWQYWPGFDDNQVGLRKDREGTTYPLPPGYAQDEAEAIPEQDPVADGELPDELPQHSGITPPQAKQSKANMESKQSINEQGRATKSQNLPAADAPLRALLALPDMAEDVARSLLEQHEPEYCVAWAQYAASQGRLDNPAGYCVKGIRSGREPPAPRPKSDGRDRLKRSIEGEYAAYIKH